MNTPPKLNLLLVDDDHNDLALFGVAVDQTDLDISLATVQDGREAIAYLEGQGKYSRRDLHPCPDLILLDLKMALQDGFDFLRWRQQSRSCAATPVALFTGSRNHVEIQKALRLGAVAHVNKPLGFQELKRTVRQIWDLALSLRSGGAVPSAQAS